MSYWEGRRVLVTGAGGFIGGHLAVALAHQGARVRAFCRYNSRGDRGTLDWFSPGDTDQIEVTFGDLRDVESVQRAAVGIEIAFHLGAQIAIPYSYLNPRDFVQTNVTGALNLAQAALGANLGRVVHVSTSEVYGGAESVPITERHSLKPRSPYAASKAAADLLMTSFHHAHGLPVAIARPFNAYGPHQSARAIIPTIATQALHQGALSLGALEPRRDFTYVSDTVAGLLAVGAADGAVGRTLHVGSGRDVSIGELVGLVGEVVGRELEVELDPQRVRPADSEVPQLLCDCTQTETLTGWEAEVDLPTGLRRTLSWLERNEHRYRPREYAL